MRGEHLLFLILYHTVRSVEKSDRKIAAKMQTDTLLSFHGAATIIKWRGHTNMSGEYRSVVSCDYTRLSLL